ncbi:dimethylsulfide dehydrogenase [Halomonas sp. PR-M31]|uniref:dimethylsulfide dehydrogenase n=1 Tax=Halomonas sp. PR-M31 TaxID=1471202 RepID=UPI000A74503D|nr:dimethylsulfide dehydrogenase [Halomonas sp. PR-M31]
MAMRCSIKCAMALCASLALPGIASAEFSEFVNPNIQEIQPWDTVKVGRVPDSIYLRDIDDPDDIIWDRIPSYRTYLSVAPPVHPSTKLRFNADQGTELYFQIARTSDHLLVRLRWKDTTQNVGTTIDGFRDAAAIQFALDGSTDTSYMMGSGPEHPVNIWYWRSDHEFRVEDLAAGGYGSTTRLSDQSIMGHSAYIEGEEPVDKEWHLVMAREIDSDGEHQIDLNKEQIPFGFAVWQGDDGGRDGNKRVTQGWILLDTSIEGDDQGDQKQAQKQDQDQASTQSQSAK